MYGFFVGTNESAKILKLYVINSLIQNHPQLCVKSSKKFPHRISDISIIPLKAEPLTTTKSFIPLFQPIQINAEKDIFCLVFKPNLEDIPEEFKQNKLLADYWANIKDMFLCKNLYGYYLSDKIDENTFFFKINENGTIHLKEVKNMQNSLRYANLFEFFDTNLQLEPVNSL